MSVDGSFRFLPLPTEIHFGCGMLASLADRLRGLGCRKPILVTDQGMRVAGAVERIERLLAGAGIELIVYDAVTADSGTGLIGEAAARAREFGADSVVGLGGGSSLDYGQGGRRHGHQLGLDPGLCGNRQARQQACSDRRYPDCRGHGQRGDLLVGIHRRPHQAQGRRGRRSAVPGDRACATRS